MKRLNAKLCGASLVALAFSLNTANVNAQTCTAAPSCEALGFTKSSSDCAGKDALKCPFDMGKLYCPDSSGMYCPAGFILYSDKSCSSEIVSATGVVPIGIVFEPTRRLAMAIDGYASKVWSQETFNVEGVPNYETSEAALGDFNGKANTTKVFAYCKQNNKNCPAFEYVSSYKTTGTNAGDWYLPALGELKEIYKNREALNNILQKISKDPIFVDGKYISYASSTVVDDYNVWNADSSGNAVKKNKSASNSVLPILAF